MTNDAAQTIPATAVITSARSLSDEPPVSAEADAVQQSPVQEPATTEKPSDIERRLAADEAAANGDTDDAAEAEDAAALASPGGEHIEDVNEKAKALYTFVGDAESLSFQQASRGLAVKKKHLVLLFFSPGANHVLSPPTHLLLQGTILQVLRKASNGWWYGHVLPSDGSAPETAGWFPSNYVTSKL